MCSYTNAFHSIEYFHEMILNGKCSCDWLTVYVLFRCYFSENSQHNFAKERILIPFQRIWIHSFSQQFFMRVQVCVREYMGSVILWIEKFVSFLLYIRFALMRQPYMLADCLLRETFLCVFLAKLENWKLLFRERKKNCRS